MRSMPSRSGGGGGRGSARDREGKPTTRKKFFVRRRKVCKFCAEKLEYVDWKDVKLLQSFIPERGKILPRRMTGVCARHQRWLGVAIKRARNIALLPFAGSAAGSSAPRAVDPAKPQAHPPVAPQSTPPATPPAAPAA